jgi:hypothetical protein
MKAKLHMNVSMRVDPCKRSNKSVTVPVIPNFDPISFALRTPLGTTRPDAPCARVYFFHQYRRDRIARSGDPTPRGLLAYGNISRFVSYSILRYFSLLYCHTTPCHWFTFHASHHVSASVSRLVRTNRSLAKRLVLSIKTVQVAS